MGKNDMSIADPNGFMNLMDPLSPFNENYYYYVVGWYVVNGHSVRSDVAVFWYRWSGYYTKQRVYVKWDDSRLGIDWGLIEKPIVSEHDA